MGGLEHVFKQLTAMAAGLLIFALLSAPLHAVESARVTFIEVQGNRRIETATVLAKIKTKEGDIFSPSQIREDIRILYQLGHFEDVQVKTEGFENGLKVIFQIREKPLIRDISYEGFEELTLEKIKEAVTLLPRTAYNAQLLQENAEKIRLKYQDSGYYGAVVVPVVTELRNGDRNVVFYIEEGKKVTLQEIRISGNKAISTNEIKDALKTQEHWFFSVLGRSGTLRMDELSEDVETIRNLYFNKGYIQVQVDEPVIEKDLPPTTSTYDLLGTPNTVTIDHSNELIVHFNIKEGDQFRIASVTFKGNTTLSDLELEKEVKLKHGDVFSRDGLRQDVGRIMDRYDGIARPFAGVVPQFNINPDTRSVDIAIEIQEGGEVRIGRIDVTGNSKTRDKVVRREMRLDEGDLYSKKALKRSYERINNLGFFETVDIVPERRQRGEELMDLNVKVKEKMTGTMSIGGGYSSVDKLVGIAEITQGNLGGRGQLLKFKTQWGSTHKLFILSFSEPYLFDEPVWGKVDLYKQDQAYDGYTLDTKGLGLGVGKSFNEYFSGSVKYGFDNSIVTEFTTTTLPSQLLRQMAIYGPTIATSAVTAGLSWDSRDFYLDPKTGSRHSIFVQYAGGPLGGDTHFIKSVGDVAWYFPLFWDTVFMTRGRLGWAASLNDKPLPLGERFYVGGTGTVRGFRYGTLGPLDPVSNDRIGGNKELVFNFEYSFPLVAAARLKGLLFYDIGKAFDDHESISYRELRHSTGWGFYWLSPIGPLRFEWGYIINEKPAVDQASQFEFSIGSQF
jgi:outer membrane protein insertion porin family